jgi:hypothetical protein
MVATLQKRRSTYKKGLSLSWEVAYGARNLRHSLHLTGDPNRVARFRKFVDPIYFFLIHPGSQ